MEKEQIAWLTFYHTVPTLNNLEVNFLVTFILLASRAFSLDLSKIVKFSNQLM